MRPNNLEKKLSRTLFYYAKYLRRYFTRTRRGRTRSPGRSRRGRQAAAAERRRRRVEGGGKNETHGAKDFPRAKFACKFPCETSDRRTTPWGFLAVNAAVEFS